MKQYLRSGLCGLLLLAMLVPLVACGGAGDGKTTTAPTTTAAPVTDSDGQPIETEAPISSGLPAIDYGDGDVPGEFIIGTVQHSGIYNDFDCVEEYGEAINDAKVKRNRAVEEKYNIKLNNLMESSVGSLSTAVSKSVQSGTHL